MIYNAIKQNDLASTKNRKADAQPNKLSQGKTVYKKDSGMAFRVTNVSHANGIQHYNLLCTETGSCFYLSKFALEKDYTEESTKVEKIGLRMVKRLSRMWNN